MTKFERGKGIDIGTGEKIVDDYALENYINKTVVAGSPDHESSTNAAAEFVCAAFDAAVVKKAKGVAQLFGAQLSPPPEQERTAMAQLAHVAGSASGEIADFFILTKLAGSALNRLVGKRTAGSALGALLSEQSISRHALTGGAVGLTNGGILTPVQEGESPWRRLGNGVVEAGTFAALSGISARNNEMLTKGFWSRINANAISGGGAGLVHSNLDAWTHGRLAGVNETLMDTTGWAVGNIAFGEGAHLVGRVTPYVRRLFHTKAKPVVSSEFKPSDAVEAEVSKIPGRKPSVQSDVPSETELPNSRLVGEGAPEKPLERTFAASDRLAEIPMLEVSETISMRELARNNDPRLEQILDEYHPELQKAFPLKGEIETIETYSKYLRDPGSTWDMVILCDKAKNIIGGIQYQIVTVNGEAINKAAWGEHIWLKQEARNFTNFRGLIKIAEREVKKAGGEIVFMEFNNPEKMTPAEILEDASAGITPKDREKLWGRVGIHVPVDSTGNMLEYGQPSMGEGEPAVEFLTLGFIGPKSLTGKTMTKSDYLKLAQAAHSTIDGVDPATDPTVLNYTQAVTVMKDEAFTFVPLSSISRARDAALAARTDSMTNSIVESLAKSFTESLELETTDALAIALHKHLAGTPHSLRPRTPDVLSLALRQAVEKALKQSQSGTGNQR